MKAKQIKVLNKILLITYYKSLNIKIKTRFSVTFEINQSYYFTIGKHKPSHNFIIIL